MTLRRKSQRCNDRRKSNRAQKKQNKKRGKLLPKLSALVRRAKRSYKGTPLDFAAVLGAPGSVRHAQALKEWGVS